MLFAVVCVFDNRDFRHYLKITEFSARAQERSERRGARVYRFQVVL